MMKWKTDVLLITSMLLVGLVRLNIVVLLRSKKEKEKTLVFLVLAFGPQLYVSLFL